jgi:hypothetical protein
MGNPDLARFLSDMPGRTSVGLPSTGTSGFGPTTVVTPVAPPAPPAAVAAAPAAVPDLTAADEEAALKVAPVDPKAKYLQDLERLKVTKEEAARIIDEMLFQGGYSEEMQVTKKLKIKFRTRGQKAVDRLNKAIDSVNPQFNGSLYSLIAEYNLAHSLIQYGPHLFDSVSDANFDAALIFIKSLPSPVFQVLATKLSKFDEKLATIMTEGVVEDFF